MFIKSLDVEIITQSPSYTLGDFAGEHITVVVIYNNIKSPMFCVQLISLIIFVNICKRIDLSNFLLES